MTTPEPEIYTIGDLTFDRVFKANGITHLADLQAVMDAVEAALQEASTKVEASANAAQTELAQLKAAIAEKGGTEHYPTLKAYQRIGQAYVSSSARTKARGLRAGLELAAMYHEAEIARLKEQIVQNNEYRLGRSEANDYCETCIRHHRMSATAIRAIASIEENTSPTIATVDDWAVVIADILLAQHNEND